LSFVELLLRVVLVSLGIYFYSLMGVIAARGTMSVIMFILSLLTAQYMVGTRVMSELANLWKVAAACAAMALLVLTLRYEISGTHLNAALELIFASAFGGMVYIGTLFGLGIRLKGILETS
jgi:PST family polysaccharide transporter